VALEAPDFDVLAARGASMIWSPFSNLLLYGQTANVKAAAKAGVTIGIGSDWGPSGSKNVLGELKVAHLEAQRQGLDWSARDIVSLATSNAAKILQWDKALGSLEAGKKADVLVIESRSGDPYEALLRSSETSILLVVINGVPRLGLGALMKALGTMKGESIREGHHSRVINVAQETADPDVAKLRVSQAAELLRTALKNLPTLAAKV
jgi:5-methylthioadenosine/S-adenosylhomocysteine deaminase